MLEEDLEAFNKFLEMNKNESRKAINVISEDLGWNRSYFPLLPLIHFFYNFFTLQHPPQLGCRGGDKREATEDDSDKVTPGDESRLDD